MRIAVRLSAVVFALSLVIWLFFYYAMEPPLTAPETTVVVGVVTAVVSGVWRLWGRSTACRGEQ